ncbi:aldo/keto reductase [Eubacteriales bacterium OttesenSCG-928-N14]|nr:aldo/keto reductase [Eubacteriales bacterium OttesenSCG-928-N14]
MEKTTLGKTGLQVTRTAFGCLPIQRISEEDAVNLLKQAYDGGINFYDTARAYTDSEHKLGLMAQQVGRENIIIATKGKAGTADEMNALLEESLKQLDTDYVDLYQFHNPDYVPRPGDEYGGYDALLAAKQAGKIRHIGITAHRLDVAIEAIESGLYETLQFPFSYLSGEPDIQLVEQCERANMGFIAMKALSGGLVANVPATFTFIRQYPVVVPIYGIQRAWELEEFLALDANPPQMDEAMQQCIEQERKEFSGNFCRGCGYCLPCPAKIEIPMAARIQFFLTRAPYKAYISKDYQKKMQSINRCAHCNACSRRCPYGLDTPKLLAQQYKFYKQFVAEHADEVE